mgnify:FL=1
MRRFSQTPEFSRLCSRHEDEADAYALDLIDDSRFNLEACADIFSGFKEDKCHADPDARAERASAYIERRRREKEERRRTLEEFLDRQGKASKSIHENSGSETGEQACPQYAIDKDGRPVSSCE